MEIAPITGIRAISLFAPRSVEGEERPFLIDGAARADDEQRSARHESEEPGLEDDLVLEPEDEEPEFFRAAGAVIDVTA